MAFRLAKNACSQNTMTRSISPGSSKMRRLLAQKMSVTLQTRMAHLHETAVLPRYSRHWGCRALPMSRERQKIIWSWCPLLHSCCEAGPALLGHLRGSWASRQSRRGLPVSRQPRQVQLQGQGRGAHNAQLSTGSCPIPGYIVVQAQAKAKDANVELVEVSVRLRGASEPLRACPGPKPIHRRTLMLGVFATTHPASPHGTSMEASASAGALSALRKW